LKYLIFGLGNIGIEYHNTRHNIGFIVLDAIALASNIVFKPQRYAYNAEITYKGKKLVLLKPSTYMNLSGKAVNYWMQKEKIPIENILIISDDIALPFGSIRIKTKGSDGGHNGLSHIIETLGHNNFARLRFGIGSEFNKGNQIDYVLGEWSDIEKKILPERIDKIIEAIKSFPVIGIERTMNFFNGK
jgi:PTH1 family peptidyl-tRNA hydrolase